MVAYVFQNSMSLSCFKLFLFEKVPFLRHDASTFDFFSHFHFSLEALLVIEVCIFLYFSVLFDNVQL